MGEYFVICNLDKKELISPSGFGHGNKPGDFVQNARGGVLSGLLELLLLGGSFSAIDERQRHIVGRWAGDRIAIIGDYFSDEVAGTSWSQDEWWARTVGRDGWVNITEHVVYAARAEERDGGLRYVESQVGGRYSGLSMLHPDGTATSTPRPDD
jgi:hypothetical protein